MTRARNGRSTSARTAPPCQLSAKLTPRRLSVLAARGVHRAARLALRRQMVQHATTGAVRGVDDVALLAGAHTRHAVPVSTLVPG